MICKNVIFVSRFRRRRMDCANIMDIFCKELLKRNFFHGPTKGGQSERTRFKSQYQDTLESYAKYFGKSDDRYWPQEETRFGTSIYYQRVNIKENFVVPKKLIYFNTVLMALLAFISIGVILTK